MTPEQMAEEALGTLEEWLPGYTHPADRPQERLRLMESEGDRLVIEAESMDPVLGDGTRTYEITVSVKEIEQ